MKIYLVGGAVRDKLLSYPTSERDWVVVGATPEEMLALGYQPVGKDFPVFLHPETKEEYALARTERKIGQGYTGFSCHASPEVTLEEDLMRRDLTINAIAETPDGKLIDPYGGQKDLADKILRHVSSAFIEDPLRVLRLARFAARYAHLGFRIAPETLQLLRDITNSGELSHLVAERVWQETKKSLIADNAQIFFQTLRDSGALKVLFPEIDALFGVPNPAKWHPEIDSGIHTLSVLEQAAKLSPKPEVRFAALLHDLGKATTPKEKWPSHPGHEERGVPLVKQLCARYLVPKTYQKLAVLASRYHLHCHRVDELRADTILRMLNSLDAFRQPQQFKDFLLVCEADARGRLGFEDAPYPQAATLEKLHAVAAKVDVKPIVEAGFENKAIQEELQQQRLKAINETLKK